MAEAKRARLVRGVLQEAMGRWAAVGGRWAGAWWVGAGARTSVALAGGAESGRSRRFLGPVSCGAGREAKVVRMRERVGKGELRRILMGWHVRRLRGMASRAGFMPARRRATCTPGAATVRRGAMSEGVGCSVVECGGAAEHFLCAVAARGQLLATLSVWRSRVRVGKFRVEMVEMGWRRRVEAALENWTTQASFQRKARRIADYAEAKRCRRQVEQAMAGLLEQSMKRKGVLALTTKARIACAAQVLDRWGLLLALRRCRQKSRERTRSRLWHLWTAHVASKTARFKIRERVERKCRMTQSTAVLMAWQQVAGLCRVVERSRRLCSRGLVAAMLEAWWCKRQLTWEAKEKLKTFCNRWWRAKVLEMAGAWRDQHSLKISHKLRLQQGLQTGNMRNLRLFFGVMAGEAARRIERGRQITKTVLRRIMMWAWMNLHIYRWSNQRKSVLELRASRRRSSMLFLAWKRTADRERNIMASCGTMSRNRSMKLFVSGWRTIGYCAGSYRQSLLTKVWQELRSEVQRSCRDTQEGGEVLARIRARELWDGLHMLFLSWRRRARMRRVGHVFRTKTQMRIGRGSISTVVKHWRSTAHATRQRVRFGEWSLRLFQKLRTSQAVMAWGRVNLIACSGQTSAKRMQKRGHVRILQECVLEWWSMASASTAVSDAFAAKQALHATAHGRVLLRQKLLGWRSVIRELQLRSLRCEGLLRRIQRRQHMTAFGDWDDAVEEAMRRRSSAKCWGARMCLTRTWRALAEAAFVARRIRVGSRMIVLLWEVIVGKSLVGLEQTRRTSAVPRLSWIERKREREREMGTATQGKRRADFGRCLFVSWRTATDSWRKDRRLDVAETREGQLKTLLKEAGERVGELRNAIAVLRAQGHAYRTRIVEGMGKGRDKGLLGRALGRMAGLLLGEATTESRRMVGACLELHLRKRMSARVVHLWSEVARTKSGVAQQGLAKRRNARMSAIHLAVSTWRSICTDRKELRRRSTILQRKREQCWKLDVLAIWVERIAIRNEGRLLARGEAAAGEYFSRKIASEWFTAWRLVVVEARKGERGSTSFPSLC